MMPLLILLFSFLILRLTAKFYPKLSVNKAGRMAFSLMFVFTGISHFIFAKGMVMSIPDIMPFKLAVVYITGVIELLLAAYFLSNKYRNPVAKLILAFLVAILPANIWATIHHVDIPSATYNGPGLQYLWFRIPLQVFFILWVYHFGIKAVSFIRIKYEKGKPPAIVSKKDVVVASNVLNSPSDFLSKLLL